MGFVSFAYLGSQQKYSHFHTSCTFNKLIDGFKRTLNFATQIGAAIDISMFHSCSDVFFEQLTSGAVGIRDLGEV